MTNKGKSLTDLLQTLRHCSCIDRLMWTLSPRHDYDTIRTLIMHAIIQHQKLTAQNPNH